MGEREEKETQRQKVRQKPSGAGAIHTSLYRPGRSIDRTRDLDPWRTAPCPGRGTSGQSTPLQSTHSGPTGSAHCHRGRLRQFMSQRSGKDHVRLKAGVLVWGAQTWFLKVIFTIVIVCRRVQLFSKENIATHPPTPQGSVWKEFPNAAGTAPSTDVIPIAALDPPEHFPPLPAVPSLPRPQCLPSARGPSPSARGTTSPPARGAPPSPGSAASLPDCCVRTHVMRVGNQSHSTNCICSWSGDSNLRGGGSGSGSGYTVRRLGSRLRPVRRPSLDTQLGTTISGESGQTKAEGQCKRSTKNRGLSCR